MLCINQCEYYGVVGIRSLSTMCACVYYPQCLYVFTVQHVYICLLSTMCACVPANNMYMGLLSTMCYAFPVHNVYMCLLHTMCVCYCLQCVHVFTCTCVHVFMCTCVYCPLCVRVFNVHKMYIHVSTAYILCTQHKNYIIPCYLFVTLTVYIVNVLFPNYFTKLPFHWLFVNNRIQKSDWYTKKQLHCEWISIQTSEVAVWNDNNMVVEPVCCVAHI